MTSPLGTSFDREVRIDPDAPLDAFLRDVPAKWVVYLMRDVDERPVQLLCVKNLRYSLKRRLSGEEDVTALPSKRVNYREIVRSVAWQRVDSAFEADVVYLEAARQFFPQTYSGMTGLRPAWFVHVNTEAEFPRYTRTTDLGIQTGQLFGPIENREAAAKFIDDVADWFDLCRYHHVLTQAPKGVPCAYKEMGKCPSPCDGTIGMDQYRRLVELSVRSVTNPDELVRQQTQRMHAAAKELRFESAAKIKAYVDSLGAIGKGPLRHLRRLRDFNFLSIQHGPKDGRAKVFLITPGRIEEVAGIPCEPGKPSDLLRLALSLANERHADSVGPAGTERIGIVAHHLFQPKAQQGVFLPLDTIDEKAVVKAYRDLLKQKKTDETEGEGVMKELQAL